MRGAWAAMESEKSCSHATARGKHAGRISRELIHAFIAEDNRRRQALAHRGIIVPDPFVEMMKNIGAWRDGHEPSVNNPA